LDAPEIRSSADVSKHSLHGNVPQIRRGSEQLTTVYLAAKAKGDTSRPSKREEESKTTNCPAWIPPVITATRSLTSQAPTEYAN
jgi:hypothetical protein